MVVILNTGIHINNSDKRKSHGPVLIVDDVRFNHTSNLYVLCKGANCYYTYLKEEGFFFDGFYYRSLMFVGDEGRYKESDRVMKMSNDKFDIKYYFENTDVILVVADTGLVKVASNNLHTYNGIANTDHLKGIHPSLIHVDGLCKLEVVSFTAPDWEAMKETINNQLPPLEI